MRNSEKYRHEFTIDYVSKVYKIGMKKIFDLGPPNELSRKMRQMGLDVTNSEEGDLDYHCSFPEDAEVLCAFEILEHLVNPFPILNKFPGSELIASVPLNKWFKRPHWNMRDGKDCHYHEFYPEQFRMLLEKTGWVIRHSIEVGYPLFAPSLRPIIWRFTPRWLFVRAVRWTELDIYDNYG